MNWRQELKLNRPAGWEESDDEDDGVLEEQFQPLALPEYSNTWLGSTCSFVHKSWIAFEGWAAAFLGLDESKYEWAKYEQQIDLEEELENIATNNMPSQRVAESMEEGQLKPGTMEMSRFGPQGGARRNQIQHFLQA